MSETLFSSAATHVVELTPAGRAAVAVVLVAGPEAVRAVGDCFTPVTPRSLASLPIGPIVLGRWGAVGGEELLVCRRAADRFEIHCHGGAAAVNAVIRRLIERGCYQLSWQEWLRQSSPHALRTAAQIALAEAPTARTAAVLLDQYHGALSAGIQRAIEAITSDDWPRAAEIIDRMLSFCDLGLHLTTPWRVVLAGAPNVGKSSLINALAGYERAIVSPQPGTTRDVVTTSTAIAGWPVQLADTAGIRDTADTLESAGVSLAAATLKNADVVVIVRDASREVAGLPSNANEVAKFVAAVPPRVRAIRVVNKVDLLDAAQRRGLDLEGAIATSAATGEGLSELMTAIAHRLVPIVPGVGEAVPFAAEQVAGLEAARRAIDECDATGARFALSAFLDNCDG